ncbi:MAG: hypothetical protein HY763_16875 [Planctomycetes bacterium]|nr:hypothetical protein [Planctomycetota bacterium]
MPYLTRPLRAVVQLQLLTGARPGELLAMRPRDLEFDTAAGLWLYRPEQHKNAFRERERLIYLGPQAQEIIKAFLPGRATDAFLFSPRESDAEYRGRRKERRTTPQSCGNRPGTNRQATPRRGPGDRYTTSTYNRGVQYACDRAFLPPQELARRVGETTAQWHERLGAENRLEDLRVLAGRFEEFPRLKNKARHLDAALFENEVRAGRRLIEAIDAGGFPPARENVNGVWWDRAQGKIPGGFNAVCVESKWPQVHSLVWVEDSPRIGYAIQEEWAKSEEYLSLFRDPLQPWQYARCWLLAITNWLSKQFPQRFTHQADMKTFKALLAQRTAREIEARRSSVALYKDDARLPHDATPSPPAVGPVHYDVRVADHQAADVLDDADWSNRQRDLMHTDADACRLVAGMVNEFLAADDTSARSAGAGRTNSSDARANLRGWERLELIPSREETTLPAYVRTQIPLRCVGV